MCTRCAELEDEITFLREQLGIATKTENAHRVSLALGLMAAEFKILDALYKARNRPFVSRDYLLELLGEKFEDGISTYNNLTTHIAHIRNNMGKKTILNVYGQGYCLGPSGAEAYERAVRSVSEIVAAPL